MHVAAAPGIPSSIDWQRTLGSDDEVMGVLLFLGHVHGGSAAFTRHIEAIAFIFGCTIEKPGDGFRNQFDVTDFFDADPLDQIEISFAVATEIKALEEILHHRTHLAELPSESFLQRVGSGGIWFIVDDWID